MIHGRSLLVVTRDCNACVDYEMPLGEGSERIWQLVSLQSYFLKYFGFIVQITLEIPM